MHFEGKSAFLTTFNNGHFLDVIFILEKENQFNIYFKFVIKSLFLSAKYIFALILVFELFLFDDFPMS